MTLPHRVGYSVPNSANKKKAIEQNVQPQQQQQTQNVPDSKPFAPPYGVPPQLIQSMHNDNNVQMPASFNTFPMSQEGLGVTLATPSIMLPSSTELRFTLERPVGHEPLAFNFVPSNSNGPLKTVSNAGDNSINIPPEELLARRQYVVQHRLFPSVMELLMSCKKDNILPAIENLATLHELTGASDFGLDDFLQAQGIETTPLATNEDPQKINDRAQFILKLEQLKERYKEQLERLNKICDEYSARMFLIMREQSALRPVLDKEMQFKLLGLQQKFDYLRNQLRQTVCNSVISLQKQYNQERKKRKSLSKKATELLSQWFFAHINDPYPSEEEKIMLAASGNLTIAQVNYWFGNKRIRYKRKCLEEESHNTISINSMEGNPPAQTTQVSMPPQAQPPQQPQHPIAQTHAPAPVPQPVQQLPSVPQFVESPPAPKSKKAAQPRASKSKKESAKERKAEQKAKEVSQANQNMNANNNNNMNMQNNAHMMNQMAHMNQLNQMNHPMSHMNQMHMNQMNQMNGQMNPQMGQPMQVQNNVMSDQHMMHMPHIDDHMMNMAHIPMPFNMMGMGMGMMGIPVSMGVPNMGFYPVSGQHPNGMQLPHMNAMLPMQGVHSMMMEPPRETDTHSFLV